MPTLPADPRRLKTPERLWLRYLIADLEGDVQRMQRLGRILDTTR